jgi:hypothetical protein
MVAVPQHNTPNGRRRRKHSLGWSQQQRRRGDEEEDAALDDEADSDDENAFADYEYQRLQEARAWRDAITALEHEVVVSRERHEFKVETRLDAIAEQERKLAQSHARLSQMQANIDSLKQVSKMFCALT